ncbi:TetR/AcrR family transcriptional regulator [Puniceibacterium sp. IMCC21224]|uniref:TetR/AcrR family transcriptional regulator n=1 Tax=Puniceibacterium sp. IMCC21224 TaxID=1618204 RepID=UPI00064DFB2D|nr:TetR/AcrR family transcriptional regulator [Puniceibacterium sp. IMCC21224]KMK64839.1 transcriptional regulator, TetR family [Puniceibacterium sp. IMCC21224]
MSSKNARELNEKKCNARHAAGADPAKRGQILAGAKRVFLERGFDAAGVNDICRAAGVSKSTLYIYFDNKEDLFESMVELERDRRFETVTEILTSDAPPTEVLHRYGCAIASIVCSDEVVQAQRIIIGIAERMPTLGARFFAGGPLRSQTDLAAFLHREVKAGRLVITDVSHAAVQFLELSTASLWKPRLFGQRTDAPLPAEIEVAVASAVALFMAAYQRGDVGPESGA